MSDVFSRRKRSEVMSRIKGRDTKPELKVRSVLHRLGFRFRVHKAGLVGRPDIVLSRYKTVVFVHGCFWHRHPGCKFAYTPRSRVRFWMRKLRGNIERDRLVRGRLRRLGWNVLVVWECDLREPERLKRRLLSELRGLKATNGGKLRAKPLR